MGCCGGSDNSEDSSNSRNIDAQLKKEKAKLDSEVKLLLLGAGESGKSTIVKQMKIIHQEGYTAEERASFKEVIHSNTIQSMKSLISNAEKLGVKIETPENEARALKIADLQSSGEAWSAEIGKDIQELWKDKGIKETFSRKSEFQLNDSAQYYFDNLDRINASSYVPDEQDVLRSRVRTTGIVEIQFNYGNLRFRLFDVGGQRNERKKWIHCFQGVTAVIFCVALSEYDQKLFEDESQNRMKESLLLFDEICNSRWFIDTSMILFLNKTDLFREKIQKTDLTVCFPSYKGGCDYDKATEFIKQRFEELNKTDTKQVYTHFTCATDTNNIKFVFNAVKDIILQNNLRQSGFM
eukprot:TRINITY_DN78_c0_g1_i1.p1 TRINITY_DN78_c0_g1~~TRINITY_DN78_c0_g1_i1.p1  ORF type:complete len:352 (-),score=102.98 TRINITY_DN78_c0_g1_i1:352-1407(-)